MQDYNLLTDQADQMGFNSSIARTIVSNAMRQEDPENVVEGTRGVRSNVKIGDEMSSKAFWAVSYTHLTLPTILLV